MYHVSCVCARAGLYEARGWLNGEPVRGAALVRVRPGLLCLANCVATGEGVRVAAAGAAGGFMIRARDASGNMTRVGGAVWSVRVSSADAKAGGGRAANEAEAGAKVTDLGDGRYRVGLRIARAGRYAVSVRLRGDGLGGEGELMPGAPFELLVQPSASDPSSCVLRRGWEGGVVAGAVVSLTLEPDSFGGDEAAFRAHLASMAAHVDARGPGGPERVPVVAYADEGGKSYTKGDTLSYTLHFSAKRASAQAALHIAFGGVPIEGSPFAFAIAPGPATSANTRMRALGSRDGYAGKMFGF